MSIRHSGRYVLIIKALYDYQEKHGAHAHPASVCMSERFYQDMVNDIRQGEAFDVMLQTVGHVSISIDRTGKVVDFVLLDTLQTSVP